MRSFDKRVADATIIILFTFFLTGINSVFAATTPSLGMANTYGILSSTYVNTSVTTINGDVGFTLAGAPAVAPLGVHTNYGVAAPYPQAGIDQGAALTALSAPAQPCTFSFAPGAIDLSTDITHGLIGVYGPGVYCSVGAMTVGGPLTFSGAGTYIFRSFPAALDTTIGSVISLTNGASACDIFWIATNTTLAATTTFVGTVIDDSFITVGANTTWTGRALSYGGTVTTNTDTITAPICTAGATLHIIKQVVNTGGGTAVPSSFMLHVKNGGVDVAGSPLAGAGTPGTSYTLSAGTYTISEDVDTHYTQSVSGDCSLAGSITLASGNDKTCTITNTYIVPVSSGGGGGQLSIDSCPNGDFSASYYDGSCGTAPVVTGTTPIIVPLIGILKVPTPLALSTGSGKVTYNYTVWNVGGKRALTSVTVVDDKCSPVVFLSGDVNNNKKLDPTEKWKYSCISTLLKTTTNTAIATGYSDDIYHQTAVATAVATVVVGSPLPPPLISIVKVPSRLTPFSFGGGEVKYTYTVTNPGVATMHDVVVSDDKCAPVVRTSYDVNGNNLLDPSETWTYACTMFVPVSTRNIATAEGKANGFTVHSYAFANVLVSPPHLPNTGLPPENNTTSKGIALFSGILVLVGVSSVLIMKKYGK